MTTVGTVDRLRRDAPAAARVHGPRHPDELQYGAPVRADHGIVQPDDCMHTAHDSCTNRDTDSRARCNADVTADCCAESAAHHGSNDLTAPRPAATIYPTFERTSVGLTPGPAMYEEISPDGEGEPFYEPITAERTAGAAADSVFASTNARPAPTAAYEAPVALNPAYGSTPPLRAAELLPKTGANMLDESAYVAHGVTGGDEYLRVDADDAFDC